MALFLILIFSKLNNVAIVEFPSPAKVAGIHGVERFSSEMFLDDHDEGPER
jgi:hypothetical protein